MSRYRMYNCECDAQLIDASWCLFLSKERGIKSHVGDYLVKCLDGREEVWTAERFEKLFYLLPDETR